MWCAMEVFKKKHGVNICLIILAAFLLIFGLWQLDLIVSGPVWYGGSDYGWSHASSRYADDYFQCWLWKTTIGGAYDVLFFTIFGSFWVLFAGLWTWKD